MAKKKKLLLSACIITVLLGVIVVSGIAITYEKAGDYILQQMIEKQLTDTLLEEVGINLNDTERPITEEEALALEQSVFVSNKQTQQSSEVATQGEKSVQENKKISSQNETSTSTPKTTQDVKKMVVEKVKEVTQAVPSKDKKAMTSLVMSQLSMAEINQLIRLVGDGVSGKDLQEAKKIALESFDEEQLEQARVYYEKYKHLIP